MPLGGRKGGEQARKVTQKSGPDRGQFFSLQMDSQGGGKLGANQYLPGATKNAGGKGHTGYVYGECRGGGRGTSRRRFYWAMLTLVPANLGVRIDKSLSPASSVRPCRKTGSLRDPMWRGRSGVVGARGIRSALSLGLSLQAGTSGQVLPWLLGSPPGLQGTVWGALPNPDSPVEYTHFRFECTFPFWASDQITASAIASRSSSQATGPAELLAQSWSPLGFSCTNIPPCSQEGLHSQTQGKGFSGWFLDGGGPGTLCRIETVFSPVPLGRKVRSGPKESLSPVAEQREIGCARVPGKSAPAQTL